MKRVVRYTSLAERDLDDIVAYTRVEWGDSQAIRYLDDLEECCERIAGNPSLGRDCGAIRSGLLRVEQGSNVIFYMVEDRYVMVVRILHKTMLPALHEFAE